MDTGQWPRATTLDTGQALEVFGIWEVLTRPGGLTRGGARWMLVVVNGNQQGCHEQ